MDAQGMGEAIRAGFIACMVFVGVLAFGAGGLLVWAVMKVLD